VSLEPDRVLTMVIPQRVVEYGIVYEYPDGNSETRQHSTRWSRPHRHAAGVELSGVEYAPFLGRAGREVSVVLGAEGYGISRRGGAAVWPRMVVLPERVRPGLRWEATHDVGGQRVVRSCELEATPFCEDGIAARCMDRERERTVEERRHFCPGWGQVGLEGRFLAAGEREWTSYRHVSVVVDGRVAPVVHPSERTLD
jgi:hypothetical protein